MVGETGGESVGAGLGGAGPGGARAAPPAFVSAALGAVLGGPPEPRFRSSAGESGPAPPACGGREGGFLSRGGGESGAEPVPADRKRRAVSCRCLAADPRRSEVWGGGGDGGTESPPCRTGGGRFPCATAAAALVTRVASPVRVSRPVPPALGGAGGRGSGCSGNGTTSWLWVCLVRMSEFGKKKIKKIECVGATKSASG